MQIISQFAPLPLAQPEKGTAVAMGFFDGIHIGHRAVIESAVQWAKEHDAAPAVFTFKLPVVNKMKGKRLLSTADKHALIASLGVEYYLTPDFEEIKGLTPEQFVLGIVLTDGHSLAFEFGKGVAVRLYCARGGWVWLLGLVDEKECVVGAGEFEFECLGVEPEYADVDAVADFFLLRIFGQGSDYFAAQFVEHGGCAGSLKHFHDLVHEV